MLSRPHSLLAPPYDVCATMADKYVAHVFFEEHGIPSPRTWLPGEVPADARYPLLVKIREGFGSRHIYRAADPDRARVLPRAHAGRVDGAGALPRRGVLDRRLLRPRGAVPERDRADDDPVEGRRVDQGHVVSRPRADRARRAAWPRRSASSARRASSASASRTARCRSPTSTRASAAAFPLPLAAGSRYPELALALARRRASRAGARRLPRDGVSMTRFFTELCFVEGADGALEILTEPTGDGGGLERQLDGRAAAARRQLEDDAGERPGLHDPTSAERA